MGVFRMNKEELLEEMDVAEMTLRKLIQRHGFPHPRKAGAQKIFWLVSEVVAWLESCPEAWSERG
ncbi:helix-turn-helix transcriptional regulator [Comamonas sp.]|uniref:helix-turn-helix transcriptional regulator n=1 Tax=Comamonas sp. TaxID=34028 RepID=UPI003D111809